MIFGLRYSILGVPFSYAVFLSQREYFDFASHLLAEFGLSLESVRNWNSENEFKEFFKLAIMYDRQRVDQLVGAAHRIYSETFALLRLEQ